MLIVRDNFLRKLLLLLMDLIEMYNHQCYYWWLTLYLFLSNQIVLVYLMWINNNKNNSKKTHFYNKKNTYYGKRSGWNSTFVMARKKRWTVCAKWSIFTHVSVSIDVNNCCTRYSCDVLFLIVFVSFFSGVLWWWLLTWHRKKIQERFVKFVKRKITFFWSKIRSVHKGISQYPPWKLAIVS